MAQGLVLAPLVFNAFVSHFLDVPWRKRHPWPLIRYADDILILTGSKAEAQTAHRAVRELARSAGFTLNEAKTLRVNMNQGSLRWLGHEITRTAGTYTASVPEDRWLTTVNRIKAWRGKNRERAESVAFGFLSYHAPAWTPRGSDLAVSRLIGAIDEGNKSPSEGAGRMKQDLKKAAERAAASWKAKSSRWQRAESCDLHRASSSAGRTDAVASVGHYQERVKRAGTGSGFGLRNLNLGEAIRGRSAPLDKVAVVGDGRASVARQTGLVSPVTLEAEDRGRETARPPRCRGPPVRQRAPGRNRARR